MYHVKCIDVEVSTAPKLLAIRVQVSCRSSPLVTPPRTKSFAHMPPYFLGFGIFSYAFGLGALFGFLFDFPLPSPAP